MFFVSNPEVITILLAIQSAVVSGIEVNPNTDPYASKNVINFDELKSSDKPSNQQDFVLKIPEPEKQEATTQTTRCPDCHNKKGFTLQVHPPTRSPKPTRATAPAARTTSSSSSPTAKLHLQQPAEANPKQPPAASAARPALKQYDDGSDRCVGSCPSYDFHTLSFIYLPHQNCNKFCFCSEGSPIVMRCSPNTVFDYYRQVCSDPRKVTCNRYLSTATSQLTAGGIWTKFMYDSLIKLLFKLL